METFEQILSAGGHMNSLGRSTEVLDTVKAEPHRIEELFTCIYADDAWVRMRAIDTFEKLVRENPTLGQPYASALVEDLTKKDQPSIQWHLAQLFVEITLSPEQTTAVLDWLTDRLSTTEVDWIVSANAMKTLLHFYKKKVIKRDEVVRLFEVQSKHASKSVRKKANDYLRTMP